MKKETNKKMTIEDLAVMVGKGFSEVHEKIDNGFARVDKKFGEVNKKFDKVHKEIEDLAIMTGNGFKEVHEKMNNRLTIVENNQLDLKLRMNILSKQQK